MKYKTYTIKDLEENELIIFSSIMGSHAYGTNMKTSDIDKRGIFIQPLEDILKYGYIDQVSDEKNDIIYYEIKRFLELTEKNNPNILEMLYVPEDCILKTSDLWDFVLKHKDLFLSKQCKYSFGEYAKQQIRKAKGYNKMINWEESQMKRKTIIDFCYILMENGGSKPFKEWAEDIFTQERFGLAKVDHAHDVYAMYDLDDFDIPKGIVSDEDKSNQVQLVSIPKGLSPIKFLTFNKDAYSTHCKNYNEYQKWIKNRNEDRFKMNKEHGKNYDSKNLSHCIRLLNVAIEIAKNKKINVRRSDEEIKTLMSIRKGEFDFDELIKLADDKSKEMEFEFEHSTLPNKPIADLNSILLYIREKRYGIYLPDIRNKLTPVKNLTKMAETLIDKDKIHAESLKKMFKTEIQKINKIIDELSQKE